MFDLATRPQPAHDAALQAGIPFDWRLTPALAATAYPYSKTQNGQQLGHSLVLATYALALEDTLATAVVLSLFTDARAGRDDTLPLHSQDRRGWLGDEDGDAWGSRLWLLYTGKVQANVLERARFAAQESLDWLVRDGIASRVVVATSWAGALQDRLAIRVSIHQPERAQPVYDVLWGTSLMRWASA